MPWTEQIAPVSALAFVIGAMATLVVLLARDLEREAGGDRVRLIRDWFDYAVGIFAIGGVAIAVFAALVAYSELRDVRENARVARTLGYVNRLKSGALFTELRSFANLLTPEVQSARKTLATPAEQIAYLRKLYAAGNAIEPIRDLADFYDELFVCSAVQICDASLAARLIGRRDIMFLYAWVQPLLTDPRIQGSGCGLKAFRDMVVRGAETLETGACPTLIR